MQPPKHTFEKCVFFKHTGHNCPPHLKKPCFDGVLGKKYRGEYYYNVPLSQHLKKKTLKTFANLVISDFPKPLFRRDARVSIKRRECTK